MAKSEADPFARQSRRACYCAVRMATEGFCHLGGLVSPLRQFDREPEMLSK